MNPAAFAGSHGTGMQAFSPLHAHNKHLARRSLGETTTPRPRTRVVNLSIDSDGLGESRALPGFFQDHT
jgi:hypothetical protein